MNGSNFPISQTSNTSNNSVKNITSLAELANGQNFNKPSTNYIDKDGSLLKNNIEHLSSYSW